VVDSDLRPVLLEHFHARRLTAHDSLRRAKHALGMSAGSLAAEGRRERRGPHASAPAQEDLHLAELLQQRLMG
jgi:hypothetical protein